MIRKTIDGRTVDTDKFSDVDSEIFVKVDELYNLCRKYDVPVVICCFQQKQEEAFFATYIVNKDEPQDINKASSRFQQMIRYIDTWLHKRTGGRLFIAQK